MSKPDSSDKDPGYIRAPEFPQPTTPVSTNIYQDRRMLFNALIRTHHITSRKKIAALKKAADAHNCFALLRTGGSPGVMYVEGRREEDVGAWVGTVQRLKYKDYQLVTRPGPRENEAGEGGDVAIEPGLREVDSIKEFGAVMKERGCLEWWRKGMGYIPR